MRRNLLDGLTGRWHEALAARKQLTEPSPEFPETRPGESIEASPDAGIWPLTCGNVGGRYWDRTSDLFGVNEALSR